MKIYDSPESEPPSIDTTGRDQFEQAALEITPPGKSINPFDKSVSIPVLMSKQF